MGYQIELRHYQYFLVLAEELNYRKAAERLFISQPGLSRQIKQMEEILNVELFTRTKRNVSLTVPGQYLKKEVESIFNQIRLTEKNLKQIKSGNTGFLKIGFVGSAMHSVIPDILLKIKSKFPLIHATLQELPNDTQLKEIENNKLDLGFVRVNLGMPGLKLAPIHYDEFYLAVHKNHPLTESTFTSLNQVSEEDFILFNRDFSPSYFDQIMTVFDQHGFKPKISHTSVHAFTIYKLIECGFGVAIIPGSMSSGFNMDVKFLKIPQISTEAQLSIVWNPQSTNPAMLNVVEMLEEDYQLKYITPGG